MPVLDMRMFKNIIKIEHNVVNNKYKFFLEEKCKAVANSVWRCTQNFLYIMRYLDSLGCTEAHNAKVHFQIYLDKLHESSRKISELSESPIIGKKYIIRLNKATKDFIKSNPYMKRKNVLDLNQNGLVKELVINQKWCDITGFTPKIYSEKQGWEFAECMQTPGWLSIILKYFYLFIYFLGVVWAILPRICIVKMKV